MTSNVCALQAKKSKNSSNIEIRFYNVLDTKTVLIMTCFIPSGSKAELALGFFLVVVFLGLRIDS